MSEIEDGFGCAGLVPTRRERDLDDWADAIKKHLEAERNRIRDLQAQLAAKDEEIAALRAASLQAQIRDLERERDELRAEVERLLKEQRRTCPCGKDTASLKHALCYNCRQILPNENEALREALRRVVEAADMASASGDVMCIALVGEIRREAALLEEK